MCDFYHVIVLPLFYVYDSHIILLCSVPVITQDMDQLAKRFITLCVL